VEVFEAIKRRHSYRNAFLDRNVPREDIEKIILAGIRAPSGKNAQTTSFVAVDNKKLLEEIGQMHTMKAMRTAKAMIVCIMDKNPQAVYEGYAFQIEDCAAAVENMLLAITALGYAAVWIDGWLRLEGRAEKIGKLLNIPQEKFIRVLLPLGVPEEKLEQKQKKPFGQRACFNQYNIRF